MANRGRDEANNAGALSEGAKVFCESPACAVQTRGGGRSHQHPISTAHAENFIFPYFARAQRGLRSPGPATPPIPPPHLERAHGHEASPLRGRSLLVRCLDRRPQVQGAPTPTARPRWSGRTTHSPCICDWKVGEFLALAFDGVANGLAAPCNRFSRVKFASRSQAVVDHNNNNDDDELNINPPTPCQ